MFTKRYGGRRGFIQMFLKRVWKCISCEKCCSVEGSGKKQRDHIIKTNQSHAIMGWFHRAEEYIKMAGCFRVYNYTTDSPIQNL